MTWRTGLLGIAAAGLLAGCNKPGPKADAGPKAKETEVVAPAGPDPAKLAAALKNTRPDRLQTAIDIALQLDDQGDDPIPALLAALKDPAAAPLGETSTEKANSPREAAVLALLKLGKPGRAALVKDGLPALKNGLTDAKPNVQEHTANAFMMAGPDAKPYAEDIAALTAAKEADVRAAAYRALEKAKAPAPAMVLKMLLSDDVNIAADAAASLSVSKPAGADAVPALVAALSRKAPEDFSTEQLAYVKNRAAEGLAGLGKDAEAAVPELVDLIRKTTEEDLVRMTRPRKPNEKAAPVSGPVLALRRIGPAAVPAVTPLLKNDQAIVRYQAALFFGGLPGGARTADATAALPDVQAALAAEQNLPTGQMYVYEELTRAAIRLGADPEGLVKQLTELLTHTDETVRYRAVNLFRVLGPRGMTAVPKLQELLADPEPVVKIAVLEVLRGIGPVAKAAAPTVGKLADDKEENVSRAAVQTLTVIGFGHPAAVPTLVKRLASNDRNVVIEAAQALGATGPAAQPAVDSLASLLGDENTHQEEKIAVLAALSIIGPAAKGAMPAVTKTAGDRDYQLRSAAIACVGKIAPYDAAVGKLFAEKLKDAMPTVRVAALKTYAAYGPAAASGATDIKAMMDGTKSVEMKVAAAAALVALGVDADKNAAVVLENLKPGAAARTAALDVVPLLGDKAKPGVPDLTTALKDKTPTPKNAVSVREKAAVACGRLPALTTPVVPLLMDLLKDVERPVRVAAATALGMYGPEAVIAVPKLREAADGDDDALRDAAAAALEKIVPGKGTAE